MTAATTPAPAEESSARDRLLLAAAQLMEAGDRAFSTRAVCDIAGVKAPTLYHHFGNKQGLVDAVIHHGFTQYVASDGSPDRSEDPVADLRAGWDRHVQFGLAHPSFYAMLYGRVIPGVPCTITAPALDMLERLLGEAARRRMLRATLAEAAGEILAANVGVTLTLIAQPEDERDFALSDRVREAILTSVLSTPRAARKTSAPTTRATAAVALASVLDDDRGDLTDGELALMRELLSRLGSRR